VKNKVLEINKTNTNKHYICLMCQKNISDVFENVFSALCMCDDLKFRSDRIVSTCVRRSYVTRARIALLTSASIHSRCKRCIEAVEVYKCLRAIDGRAIHFVPAIRRKTRFQIQWREDAVCRKNRFMHERVKKSVVLIIPRIAR